MKNDEIIEIPCSIPVHIDIDLDKSSGTIKATKYEFIADPETLRLEQEKVANQGKAK